MKNLKNLISLITILLLLSSFSFASKFISKRSVLIQEDEVINEDLFALGERITINGKVNGDLFFLAREISINGEVSGDVIGMANTITINGIVFDDVRTGAQFMNINGKIGKNTTLTGQFININRISSIGGDLIVGGNEIKVDGVIGGEVRAGDERISVGGDIGKSLVFYGREIFVSESSIIKGDLQYRAEKAEIIEGAKVQGKVEKLPTKEKPKKSKYLSWRFYFWKLVFMVAGIIVGFVFIKLFPSLTTKIKEQTGHIWKSLGIGFALLICVPIVSVILAITLLGLPISLILIALYLIFLYLGKIIFASFIGDRILKKDSPFLSLLIGMPIFTVLFALPFIGWILKLIAISIGLGASGVGSYIFFKEAR